MNAIIVVGPPRSGKTLNRLAIMSLYGCDSVYDADEPELAYARGRVLVFAHKPPKDPTNRRKKLEGRVIPIEEVKATLGVKWIEPFVMKE